MKASTLRHNDELIVQLGVLAGLDLAGKFVDVGQVLRLAGDEAVGLGEQLVLEAHADDIALFELADQAAGIVEVAVARVAVEQNRQIAVASAMNSSISRTCVQLASLLSRTPNCADIARPLAQIPAKPASSAILALRPLWASSRNSS